MAAARRGRNAPVDRSCAPPRAYVADDLPGSDRAGSVTVVNYEGRVWRRSPERAVSTSVETCELGGSVNGRGGPARFDPAVSGRGGGHSGGEHRQFRPDVEGLRAVAIVLVVLYHVHAGLAPGGYVGVDVFFVISGFLITGQLVRELRTDGRISFLAFYARRARRILPAAMLTVIVTAVASALLLNPLAAKRALDDVLSGHLLRGERSLCGSGRRLFQRRAFSLADPAFLVLGGRGAVLHRLAAAAGRLVLGLASEYDVGADASEFNGP